ncbi:MAG: serine/threonine protein kinase [Deltaproteobacteria bacterium]|nr:serine/threonine protein kinase [Deltaproteobacteria bacterium]
MRRYELLEELGRGAFGAVWRARLIGRGAFSREVAIKLLHSSVTEHEHGAELLARLRDEARLLGLLRHRAIVAGVELVHFEEGWAVVLELVEGADLGEFVSRGVPVSVVWEIVAEVASGLRCALDTPGLDGKPLLVQHRDIKPQNLRVTAGGEVKILDLGIARAEFAAREAETQAVRYGTLGYMSPERLAGVDLPAGDIYALGVTAAELLIGASLGRAQIDPDAHNTQIAAQLAPLPITTPERGLLSMMLAARPGDRPDAREVERRARALRLARGVEAPSLLSWAERAVPEALKARRPGQRLAAPRALTEQRSAPLPPSPPLTVGLPPPPDRPRVTLAPWVFFGACASLFVGGLALLVTSRLSQEATLPPAEAVAGVSPTPPEPPPAVVLTPAPAVATAAPTPPPPKAAGVTLTVASGAEGVTLIRDGQSFTVPGTVPLGTYRASMSGWGAETNSLIQITGPGTLSCDTLVRRCRLVPAPSR